MSLSQDVAGVLEARRVFFTITCVEISVLALFLYDYSLTFFREIDFVWRRKFGLPTVFYLFARYLVVLGLVYNIAGDPSQSLHIIDGLDILGRASITAVSIARTYAIFDRSRSILVLLSTFGLTFIVIDCVIARSSSCTQSFHPQNVIILFNILLSCLRLSFDIIVMALIVYKTFHAIKLQGSLRVLKRKSIASLIFTDGTLYFLSVFLMEFLNTSFSFLGAKGLKEIATAYVLPIQSLLTARFLLNLREVTIWSAGFPEDSSIEFTSLRLATPQARITGCDSFARHEFSHYGKEIRGDLVSEGSS